MGKRVRDLVVGDVVLGIGSVVFTEPHVVERVSGAVVGGVFRPAAVYASGGAFWPVPMVGDRVAVLAG